MMSSRSGSGVVKIEHELNVYDDDDGDDNQGVSQGDFTEWSAQLVCKSEDLEVEEEWNCGGATVKEEAKEVFSEDPGDITSGDEYETNSNSSLVESSRAAKGRGVKKASRPQSTTFPCRKRKCGKTFTSKCELEKHQQESHSLATITGKKRQFKCPMCPKLFNYTSSVKHHMRTHNNERPFACDVCNETFTRNNYLIRHKSSHLKVKPFQCLLCGQRQTRRDHSISHLRHFHKLKSLEEISKHISFKTPAPIRRVEEQDNEGQSTIYSKKLNMVGEPCLRRGKARMKKFPGSGTVSGALKMCSVELTPIISGEKSFVSSVSNVKKANKVVKPVDVGETQRLDSVSCKTDERKIPPSAPDVSNVIKCVFCAQTFCSSSGLVQHYSTHTAAPTLL